SRIPHSAACLTSSISPVSTNSFMASVYLQAGPDRPRRSLPRRYTRSVRSLFDTIAAPITGAHSAPVAIVRIAGPDAWTIAGAVFAPWPASPEPRRAIYGRFATGDDGFAIAFEDGHSYTGEATVELSCHGSRASVEALM